MAGVDAYIVGQGHQLAPDGGNECVVVATRQVGAADAAIEKHVACNDKTFLLLIKTQAAGRMARAEERLQLALAKKDCISGFDVACGGGGGLCRWQPVAYTYLRYCIQYGLLKGVDFEWQPIGVGNVAVAKYVVEMTVGVDEPDRAQVSLFDDAAQFFLFGLIMAAGVKDDALTGAVVYNVGIFLKRVEG